jgi:hypothetical protein
MNIEEVKKLSDDALREKVANLACAFKDYLCCRCYKRATKVKYGAFFCGDECAERVGDFDLDDGHQMLLGTCDFPNDLNAMHEVENSLSIQQWLRYEHTLGKYIRETIYEKTKGICNSIDISPVHASARQRAEVFVLIMENE